MASWSQRVSETVAPYRLRLIPDRMPDHEAVRIRRLDVPPRPRPFGIADRVPAQARDRHVGVGGAGVDRDPAAGAGFAVALERAGGEGGVEGAAAGGGEG